MHMDWPGDWLNTKAIPINILIAHLSMCYNRVELHGIGEIMALLIVLISDYIHQTANLCCHANSWPEKGPTYSQLNFISRDVAGSLGGQLPITKSFLLFVTRVLANHWAESILDHHSLTILVNKHKRHMAWTKYQARQDNILCRQEVDVKCGWGYFCLNYIVFKC